MVERGGGLPNHKQAIKDIPGVLHICTPISNPVRYTTRYSLYRAYETHIRALGARLVTIELAYGHRPFEVTEPDDPDDIQLRTSSHEIWIKECLINLAVARLPHDWQYAAWVDGDIFFTRPDVVQETIQQLQTHPIVQMFSHAIDLDHMSRPLPALYTGGAQPISWAYAYLLGDEDAFPTYPYYDYQARTRLYAHPGYCWAIRRDAWDDLGGLIESSILGAADFHQAQALTGKVTFPPGLTDGYKAPILEWKSRCDKYIQGDLGCVEGLILHNFHGSKKKRGYVDRWKILQKYQYDPAKDLKRAANGILQLTDRSPGLRDALRRYFRSRDEDSTAI